MTDTAIEEIGGVRADAPLFRGTPPEVLREIVEHISSASYHYADDSGGEWKAGREKVKAASALINKHHLPFYAIKCLHRHTPQLIALDDLMDAVLRGARRAA